MYNHNFLYVDQQSPGPDSRLTFPFHIVNLKPQASGLAEIRENQIAFSDRPMSRLALWAIRAPLSIEPFIAMRVEPGKEFTWQINYEYYTIPERAK